MSLHAVVMAAGEGRRLRPLTERWPKPVLPIDGRPVIGTLMRELVSAGFGSATVVTGHLAEVVETLLGDGAAFGIQIDYAHQPEPLGSADAVRRALAAGARPPLLVVAADTVFQVGAIARAAREWEASGAPGGLAVRRGGDEAKTPVKVENGRIVAIGGERGELTAAPLWFFAESLVPAVERVPGPPFELAAAFQGDLAAGRDIVALEIGRTRDVTRPADVMAENFPYLWKGR
ncbi:MAG: nucleotidyltransferase family protein [Gaiellaceae bacterium]